VCVTSRNARATRDHTNVALQRLAFLLRTLKAPLRGLGPDTGYLVSLRGLGPDTGHLVSLRGLGPDTGYLLSLRGLGPDTGYLVSLLPVRPDESLHSLTY
jgi:hypothetical protein